MRKQKQVQSLKFMKIMLEMEQLKAVLGLKRILGCEQSLAEWIMVLF